MKKLITIIICVIIIGNFNSFSQEQDLSFEIPGTIEVFNFDEFDTDQHYEIPYENNSINPLFGQASYYAEKFHGRRTASGEIYYRNKFTAACNVLPFGTLIRVTNLQNNRFVYVEVNDRLSKKVNRLVDLSKIAADRLMYISQGLTKVRVEVMRR